MHTYQTVDFGKAMVHRFRYVDLAVAMPEEKSTLIFFLYQQREKYSGGKAKMPMMEAILLLNNLVDESDPDVSICNVDTIGCTVL